MRKIGFSKKKMWNASLILILIGLSVSCNKFKGSDNKESGVEIMRGMMIDLDCFPEEVYASNACGLDLTETIAPGAVITESSPDFPKTVTFDYSQGCTDKWGRTRKGKVIVTVTGDMSVQGSMSTVTFDEFSVNDISIQGERFAENIGVNDAGNIVIQYSATITSSKGDRTREHSFERQREWISGSQTCDVMDDEFYITGEGTMNTCHGRTVNASITEAIHYKMRQCNYPQRGKIDIGSDKRGVLIDFGNGECDNIATVTVKRRNKTHQIDLETREIIE